MSNETEIVTAALAASSRIGPYFEVETRPTTVGGWRPLSALVQPTDALPERVDATGRALDRLTEGGAEDRVDSRVAASTLSLALAARLVSVPLATVVVGGVLPEWSIENLWWKETSGGPWPLAFDGSRGRALADLDRPEVLTEAVAHFTSTVTEGVVTPLIVALHERFALSLQVLWGNVASALTGAMTMLVEQRPDRAEACASFVGALLATGPLLGTGQLSRPDARRARWFFVRRSCCLFYRVPGGGYCADCVLTSTEDRERQWRRSLGETPALP